MTVKAVVMPPGPEFAHPDNERLGTVANGITVLRTIASVMVATAAAVLSSLTLLIAALAIYWIGDMADGLTARLTHRETRFGAVLDILSDRLCAASFYIGLAWLDPHLAVPVAIYLTQFIVIDGHLSLAFLAWPIRSPNYFYVVDDTIWRWNWSKAGKAVNSAAFAVLLLVTGSAWVGSVVAASLLLLKAWSLARLMRLGVPVPTVGELPARAEQRPPDAEQRQTGVDECPTGVGR